MWTHGSSMPRTDAGVGARLRRWWEQLSLPAEDEGRVRPTTRAPRDRVSSPACGGLPALPSTKVRGAADAEAVGEILQDLERLPVHDGAAPEHGEPTVPPAQSR